MSSDLNSIMEFDHVVQVHDDGTVTDAVNVWAPESVYIDVDDDGQQIGPDPLDWQGWQLMKGYTGQYGAGGAATVMHPSEFVGGAMARNILETPGFYVAVSVESLDDDEEPIGWAVAFKSTEEL